MINLGAFWLFGVRCQDTYGHLIMLFEAANVF